MSIVIIHGYWMLMGSMVLSSSLLWYQVPRWVTIHRALHVKYQVCRERFQVLIKVFNSICWPFYRKTSALTICPVSGWMYWLYFGCKNVVWMCGLFQFNPTVSFTLRSQRSHCNSGAGPVKEILKWCFQIIWEDDLLRRKGQCAISMPWRTWTYHS